MARNFRPPNDPDEAATRLLRAVEGIHEELRDLRMEIQAQRALVARGSLAPLAGKGLDLAREILARTARRL